jgi:hypothetical protein
MHQEIGLQFEKYDSLEKTFVALCGIPYFDFENAVCNLINS